MIAVRKGSTGPLREAGELLGVEAVDRTGLVVTSEGAFVRIFRVCPVNPLLMSGEERAKAAGTFQRLISQLHDDERIQVFVEGRPVKLAELVGDCRREVEACAGPAPSREQRGARSVGVVAVAVARGARGVAATARRQPGRRRGQSLRGGRVPAAPARRARCPRILAAREAADRAARADTDRAPARRARAPRPSRRTAIRARGRGDGNRAARRRAGRRAAVVVLQPDPGRRGSRPAPVGELLGELDAPVEREEAINAGVRLARGDRRHRASTSTATRISRTSTATPSRRSWSRRPRDARAWAGCTGRC